MARELQERGFEDVHPLRSRFKAWQAAGLEGAPVRGQNRAKKHNDRQLCSLWKLVILFGHFAGLNEASKQKVEVH